MIYLYILLLLSHQVYSAEKTPVNYPTKLEIKKEKIEYVYPFVKSIAAKDKSFVFKFINKSLSGKLYYGLYPFDTGHPPVIFKQQAKINNGKAKLKLKKILKEKYFVQPKNKKIPLRLFYRVINTKGKILYESKLNFRLKKHLKLLPSITHGPFVNYTGDNQFVISYKTNWPVTTSVTVGKRVFNDHAATKNHEIIISNLAAGADYRYFVNVGVFSEGPYNLKTFPKLGSRKAFSFGFVSDSRKGFGGGEREYLGTNYYVMRRVSALSSFLNLPFLVFTGDMISGYSQIPARMDLEYHNWKNAVGDYWKNAPVFATLGNHEASIVSYVSKEGKRVALPKEMLNESSETIFSKNFSNPMNGPLSEDNSWADKDHYKINFPSYKENVYSFEYGNIAFIVMNSNYWYAPSDKFISDYGGNPHGYIMDNQLKWLRSTLRKYQKNKNIDHIFVTFHTPLFPNGGHAQNDMWYKGDNRVRPYAYGKKAKYGIIQRRDQLLRLLDRNSKVLAVLAGDEHNYSLLKIAPNMPLYKKGYRGPKLKLHRKIWQLTNGTAGAPYYAQEILPWSRFVKEFTSQNILSVFTIKGKNVFLKSINPLTLKTFSEVKLK